MPNESLERLKTFAQSSGTTLFTVLSAGLRILLHRWSGQADFVVGTLASSRSRPGTERMIGCFVNALSLRNPVDTNEKAMDLLIREKAAVMDAFAHQDCPFAKIVENVSPNERGTTIRCLTSPFRCKTFPLSHLTVATFKSSS